MSKLITIGLIDDHRIVRNGLKQLLEFDNTFQITMEYENGLQFVKEIPTEKQIPDVFLLDYSMPLMNGMQVLQEIKDKDFNIKCVILTQHNDEFLKVDAYEAGARGFVSKTCDRETLVKTINNVHNFGYDNFEEILALLRNKKTTQSISDQTKAKLSDREFRLIELVCDEQEFTYQQIADKMNVSIKTIDACRAQLFQKLDVKSKVGLVLYSYHHLLTKPFYQ